MKCHHGIAKGKMNALWVHMPQTRCTDEAKENDWKKLDEVLQSIPASERVILSGDMSGHPLIQIGGRRYDSQNEEGRQIYNALRCMIWQSPTLSSKKITNI